MSLLKAVQAVRSGRIDTTRLRAVVRKEVRDYRRNRFVLFTMMILPIIFLVNPVVNIFTAPTDVPQVTVLTLMTVEDRADPSPLT